MPTLRVMTYNILFGGTGREKQIRDVIEAIQPDIAVFTEVTSAKSFDLIADAVGPHVAGRVDRRRREFPVIVSRWPLEQSQTWGPAWSPTKWVSAMARPFGTRAVAVHGVQFVPQPLWPFELCRLAEARALVRYLQAQAETSHVLAGDFNALIGEDRQDLRGAPLWVRAQLLLQGGRTMRWALRHLQRRGLVDCYRACNASMDGFTVPSWSPSARIDYVFVSVDLSLSRSGAGVGGDSRAAAGTPNRSVAGLIGQRSSSDLSGLASDHLPVWVDFDWMAGHAPANLALDPTQES